MLGADARAGDNETEAVTKKELVWMLSKWVKIIRKVAYGTEPLSKREKERMFMLKLVDGFSQILLITNSHSGYLCLLCLDTTS